MGRFVLEHAVAGKYVHLFSSICSISVTVQCSTVQYTAVSSGMQEQSAAVDFLQRSADKRIAKCRALQSAITRGSAGSDALQSVVLIRFKGEG